MAYAQGDDPDRAPLFTGCEPVARWLAERETA